MPIRNVHRSCFPLGFRRLVAVTLSLLVVFGAVSIAAGTYPYVASDGTAYSTSDNAEQHPGGPTADGQAPKLRREGSKLDQQAVIFRAENDALLMTLGYESKPVHVLQNLAAQRIYRACREDPDDNKWNVSGTFTEFEGRNFFMVDRAVRVFQNSKQ